MSHIGFNIPIVLFIFKRAEKTAIIIDQISKLKPSKIYLIGDGPRNENEYTEVEACRRIAEEHINWDCVLVKNYATKNRGVYENIAGGAKWVFEKEEFAIFLEDDNFPELTFFRFCKEMLEKYDKDQRILWICGTNYLQEYNPLDGSDYVFTRHMLPCGWASWSDKFCKFYDGEFELLKHSDIRNRLKSEYVDKQLYNHNEKTWNLEMDLIKNGNKPHSWDYQMSFTIRVHGLLGIVPKYNLIRNIGVDNHSIHGGNSMSNIMTKRFCEIPTSELSFPIRHPLVCLVDPQFERLTSKIIVPPLKYRLLGVLISTIKKIFRIDANMSISKQVKSLF